VSKKVAKELSAKRIYEKLTITDLGLVSALTSVAPSMSNSIDSLNFSNLCINNKPNAKNPISKVQEYFQKEKLPAPIYTNEIISLLPPIFICNLSSQMLLGNI